MAMVKRLVKRFNRLNPGYTAEIYDLESYRGCYRVYITDDAYGITSEYIFATAREFREWINGVVL